MLESTGTEQDRLCRFPEPVVSYCTPPHCRVGHGIGDLGPEAYRFVDFFGRYQTATLAGAAPGADGAWQFPLPELLIDGGKPDAD